MDAIKLQMKDFSPGQRLGFSQKYLQQLSHYLILSNASFLKKKVNTILQG